MKPAPVQSIVNKGLPTPAAAWVISPCARYDEESLAFMATVTTDAVVPKGDQWLTGLDSVRQVGTSTELPLGHPSYSPCTLIHCATIPSRVITPSASPTCSPLA